VNNKDLNMFHGRKQRVKSRTYRVESLAECADCFAGGVEFEEVGWEDRMRKEEDAI